jgi:hypothetical protein
MASKTAVTEHRRKRKIHKMGRARKRIERRDGSTPSRAKLFGDE